MLKKLMLKLGYVPIKTLRPDPAFKQMLYQQELFLAKRKVQTRYDAVKFRG